MRKVFNRIKFNYAYRLIIPGVFSARYRCSMSILLAFPLSAIFIHGCCNTASALKRFGAFFTRRPRIKSFASLLTSAHSLSGKLNRPICSPEQEKRTIKIIYQVIDLASTSVHCDCIICLKKDSFRESSYLPELIQTEVFGNWCNFHHDSNHSLLHSYPKMVDSHRVGCRR